MLVCIAVGALRPTGIFQPGGATKATPTKATPTTANPTKATPTNSLPPLDADTPDASEPQRPNWAVDAGGSLEAPTTGALDINLAPASQLPSHYNLRPRNAPALHPLPPPSSSLAHEAVIIPVAPPSAGMLGGQSKGRGRTKVAKAPKGHGVPPGNRPLGVRRPAGMQKPRKASTLLNGPGGYTLTVCAHVVCNVTWCLWFKMPSL